MWVRRTRITLLVALLLAVAVLSFFAANSQLYSGHLSRLITRNLLGPSAVSFRYTTMEGNVLGEIRFLGVDLSWQGHDGGFAYLQVDTLEVSYDLPELLKGRIRAYHLAVLSSRGTFRQGTMKLPRREKHSLHRGPPIAVEEGIVRGLDVRFIHPDGSEDHFNDVSWWGAVRKQEWGWIVDTRAMGGRWPERAFSIADAWGRTEIRPEGLRLIRLRAASDSTQVEADGWFRREGGFDLEVEAKQFRLGELLRVLGKPSPISADFAGSAHLQGFQPLKIEALAEGQVAGYPFSKVSLEMTIEGRRLFFPHAQGRLFDAPVRFEGQVDTKAKTIALSGVVDSLDLSRRWAPQDLHWPVSRLSGAVELSLDLDHPVSLDLDARGVSGRVVDLPVDSLDVVVHFQEDRGVRFDHIQGLSHGTRFEASGTVDTLGVLEMPFTARAADLSSWRDFYHLPFTRARGLVAKGRFHGPGDAPSFTVEARLDTLRAFHLEGDSIWSRFELETWDDLHHLRGWVKADDFAVDGRSMGRFRGHFDRQPGVTQVPFAEVAKGDTVLSAEGRVLEEEDWAKLELDKANFRLGDQNWILAEPLRGTIGAGWARAENLHLQSKTGEWTLRGGVDSLGVMDLDVDLTGGDLSLLAHLGQGPADLRGILAGKVMLTGSRSNPHLSVDVVGEKIGGFGRALDRMMVQGEVQGRQVRVDSVSVECPQGVLQARGKIDLIQEDALRSLLSHPGDWRETLGPAGLDLTVDLNRFNARYWMDPIASDEDLGRARASLSLGGSLQSPLVEGEVEILDYLAADGSMTIPGLRAHVNSGGQSLRLTKGVLSAPDPWLHFNAVLPLRLSFISPIEWMEDEGVKIELNSNGDVDLKPLATIIPNLLESSGHGEIVYRATGPMSHPRLEGTLKVRDGVAQLEGSLERLRDLRIDASLKDGVWRIERVTAREGMKGTISATGEVDFVGLLPDDVRLDVHADRFLFASFLHLRALLKTDDFHMTLKRPEMELPRRPYFSGTVQVIKARYTGEFGDEGGEGGLAATTSPSWLADIRLKAPRTVRIQNNTADLLIDGDVDLVRDPDGLRFNGVVEIPQGHVTIFNNDFEIVRGSLDYSRSRGLEPEVEIEARTRVRDYRYRDASAPELEEVRVFLTGTFSQLKTRFESDSGYDEETIVRLLAGFSEESGKGSLADTGFKAGLNYIERSIAREIKGIDTLDIETESASISEASRTRVAVGKYLSSDLYLRYSQGLSISEREFFLEYQMTRTLRLSSELGTRLRGGAPATTFNVGLKYRVEY